MAAIFKLVYDNYRDLMDNKSDPRVKDWPMASGPFPTLAIVLFYVYFVKVLGPKWMENRKPFDLRRAIIIYNFLQVISSFFLFREVSKPEKVNNNFIVKEDRFNLCCDSEMQ